MTKQIASTTFIVLVFILFVLLGGRLIRYFGLAAEGKLSVDFLFSIIGYNLPYLLELVLPLSFFIALMLVFGRLYVDHEMAVLNASGISRGKLARITFPFIVFLVLCEAWLSLVGRPWGVRQAESVWEQQAVKNAFELVKPGEFISSSRYHLYVGSMNEDNSELRDVILIQLGETDDTKEEDDTNTNTNTEVKTDIQLSEDSEQLVTTELPIAVEALPVQLTSKDTLILAKKAQQVTTDISSGKAQVDLFNGRRYQLSAGSHHYSQASFGQYRVTLKEHEEKEANEDIAVQTTTKLWQALTNPVYSTQSGSSMRAEIMAELGYRFALPWLILLAPMMALPLAQVRPRQGRWLKLVPSILVYTCMALAILSIKKPIEEGKVGAWIYALLVLVFITFALYLNWAGRIQQRVSSYYVSRKGDSAEGNSAGDDL